MRNGTFLVLVLILGSVGSFLFLGAGEDDRNRAWKRGQLAVVERQLAGLKQLLLEYKQSHGRFPTNDEGLAALGNYPSRFMAEDLAWPSVPSAEAPRDSLEFVDRLWGTESEAIQEFRQKYGRLPDRSEDLRLLASPLFHGRLMSYEKARQPVQVELAVGPGDSLFVLCPGGALSPWGIPYMYENHKGLDAAKFADSPANGDWRRLYSVRVDPNVYVYALPGKPVADAYLAEWWKAAAVRLVGLFFFLAAVACGVLWIRRSRRRLLSILAVLAALAGSATTGAAAHLTLTGTCYAPMDMLFCFRQPGTAARQKELLDKYRAAGVITQETYDKAASALNAAKE